MEYIFEKPDPELLRRSILTFVRHAPEPRERAAKDLARAVRRLERGPGAPPHERPGAERARDFKRTIPLDLVLSDINVPLPVFGFLRRGPICVRAVYKDADAEAL